MRQRRNSSRKVQMKLGERPEFKAQLVRLIHMLEQILGFLSFLAVNEKRETHLYN